MFYIKLEKDESLVVTVKENIFRNENLNQKIIYLIPTMIDNIDVAASRVYLNYIRADGFPNVVQLEDIGMKYSENYYQYTFPVDCKMTNVAGDVCTWLHFIPKSSEQIVAKSGECVLTIQDTKDIGDYDEEGTILPDLQDRVAFAENNIKTLNRDAHSHENTDILNTITQERVESWDTAMAPDIPEYDIVEEASGDYAATYHLTKDGVKIGASINISHQPRIYLGDEEPTDPNVIIWINPTGNGEDVLGDISAVLDEIIAIQESYIARSPIPINEEVSE